MKYHKSLLSFFMMLLVISPLFMTTFVQAERGVVADIIESLGGFGGEGLGSIATIFDQMSKLSQTLNNKGVIEDINFFIRSLFSTFRDTAKGLADKPRGETVTAASLRKFLNQYEVTLFKSLKSRPGFPSALMAHLQSAAPEVMDGISELYDSVHTSLGFGLTNGMLIQIGDLLKHVERNEYVDASTFSSIASVPEEIMSNLENLAKTFLTDDQLQMVSMMIKMYANSHKRRDEL